MKGEDVILLLVICQGAASFDAHHDMNKIATSDRGQMNFTTTEEMYNIIVSMTKKLMADVPFKDVIATGTCLQNLRTSPSFDNVKPDANAPIALQAARYALETPYAVTDMK